VWSYLVRLVRRASASHNHAFACQVDLAKMTQMNMDHPAHTVRSIRRVVA
jgi:hypothetical protein